MQVSQESLDRYKRSGTFMERYQSCDVSCHEFPFCFGCNKFSFHNNTAGYAEDRLQIYFP